MAFPNLDEFEPTGRNLALLSTIWLVVVFLAGVALVVPFQ